MNGLRWIANTDGRLSFGFDTLANAEAFLRNQSRNVDWLEQWDIKLRNVWHEQLAVVSTNKPVSLDFK